MSRQEQTETRVDDCRLPDSASTGGHESEPHPSEVLAEAILNAARAVEHAEHLIKADILRAAERGDTNRIKHVVGRWMKGPVSQVLTGEAENERR